MGSAVRTDDPKGPGKPATSSIVLPKGGGALKGIGEKFAANPVTGTASLSLPLAISPGRSGFGPQLSLSYDSGSGNGAFGFGWSVSLPAISRRTDNGLPQYRDAEDSDVYLLSGADDLVPACHTDERGNVLRDAGGRPLKDQREEDGYEIRAYRPRIEGLFVRIERWSRLSDGDVHWRSFSRENLLTLYGKDLDSRIADPADPRRIFSWLICETRDDKGNAVLYGYKPEDGAGVDLAQAHERNRGHLDDPGRAANRYLQRVRYGNRKPLLDQEGDRPRFLTAAQVQDADWMFEVVFDYGEHDPEAPQPDEPGQWIRRDDPFSSYRAGFEVRTSRLCQRVLLFHHFPGEPGVGSDCLVRSTDFSYSHGPDPAEAEHPRYTFLRAVTQSGYRRQGGAYLKRSLPPVEFDYSQPIVQDTVQETDAAALENLPIGLDGAVYQWTDLYGEGIPGILTEQGGAWFYKRNLSPIAETRVEFAPLKPIPLRPNLSLAGGRAEFMDLAGDGQPDLVTLEAPGAGLYEHDGAEGWQPFRPFSQRLNRDLTDPNLRLVDLDGDGQADVLISEDDAFVWHRSLAEEGFGPGCRVSHAENEERGPRLVFADQAQSVYLADLSGDGLADLVRIRNGEVCYWPNLGYGRFGARITMDQAPHFDHPDRFDQARIRLADIDGTGTTDIIYLHPDGVRLYFNQSGNSWSAPRALRVFPGVDNLVAITTTDLLGNGTACLVWSSPLPNDARRPLRYVDLMGGRKPHLLVRMSNNLGAETRVQYAPSTKFYLRDQRDGKPWITRLAFPVHVVERVETRDHVSGNRFVTRYAYHHGYFDGEEREFRGFAMVEQEDTEAFADLPEASNLDAASHVPPVLTKRWFHTGMYEGREHISNVFAGLLDAQDRGEYYREPGLTDGEARERLLPDTVLPSELTQEEEREACRALKGMMLRQEVYALDGTPKAEIPYSAVEQNFTVRRLQAREGQRHAVFFTHPREAVTYNYERDPVDPRVSHSLTLEVDPWGNALKEITIGYGRRTPSTDPALTDHDRTLQGRSLITLNENTFSNPVLPGNHYRTPLPVESRTCELTGFKPENNAARFSFDEWSRDDFALPASALPIPYEQTADHVARERRLIGHVRTRYRRDDLTALLPLGQIAPLGLPGESYQLALTPGLIAQVFRRKRAGQPDEELLPDPGAVLLGKDEDEGGYVAQDGGWWIPSGRSFFDPAADTADPALTAAGELAVARQHFFLPRKVLDPFGHSGLVDYDGHDLLATRTRDALGNTVTATNDYRVLQPRVVTDPNRNRTSAAYDAMGLVVATAVMGKEAENLGDLLEGFEADPQLPDLQDFIAAPHERAPSLLGRATTRMVYDLERFRRAGQPPLAATLGREVHFQDAGGPDSKVQISFAYSDGFGREIQKKIQAEPGNAPQREAPVLLPTGDVRPGDLVRDPQGGVLNAHAPRRWVGSGRTVFNNKGKPVRQYEPFFSATHLYESESDMTDTGVSPVLFYDPVDRVIAILHPNHTYDKIIFGAWQQSTYDLNDVVAARETQTGDPRTDPDIAAFVREYFKTQPGTWETWHAARIGNQMGPAEREAAEKAAMHSDTPTVLHFDPLGRPFLTIAHNRYERGGAVLEETSATRVELDVEGNQREVRDAIEQSADGQGRVVMRYDHDMLGNRIHQSSMDAGERWKLNDVLGKQIRGFDSRGFQRRMAYDALRRPLGVHVTENGTERLAERTVYGEAEGDSTNQRTRVHQLFDGAGVVTNVAYDFKGNLLEVRRDLLPTYAAGVNWLDNPVASDGSFVSRSSYDALNRLVTTTSPDTSVYRPGFNEANLVDRVEVNLRGGVATPFVTNIDYDAKGQRQLVAYGNGAVTSCEYDPLTYRLTRLKTTRPAGLNGGAAQIFSDATVVQDLRYTYDPVGNITRIRDMALETVFHDGQQVEPVGAFTYDAAYRLIEAHGREHVGQTGFDLNHQGGDFRDHPFAGWAHPNDLQAVRNFTERYEYDAAGNVRIVRHLANGGSWTRRYDYEEISLIEAGKRGNRLTRTTLGNGLDHVEPCAYDIHGSMTSMLHLPVMAWDFEDQLRRIDPASGTAYYVYDADGRRTRKVIESANGVRRRERIYLDGYELYREFGGDGVTVLLERDTLHVMDDRQRLALVETLTVENGHAVAAPSPLQRYQLGNHLGSASVELAHDGALISYEEYHPYGTSAFQAGRSVAEVRLKRYRYTARERDEESGLSYHQARYFVPWLARWASADPLGIVDGNNLYAYTRNNPLNGIDRSGKDTKTVAKTNNYRRLLREAIEEHRKKTITEKKLDELAPAYMKALEDEKSALLLHDDPIRASFQKRVEQFGRTTVKLVDFDPPGWKESAGNPEACFRLACSGGNLTAAPGETAVGGGGVILYEKETRRIKTDKTASEVALTQIKAHIDSGRAVVAGVNEPHDSGVVDSKTQPVTDHFVAIEGYEADFRGNITALLAKDNASYKAAKIRFVVGSDGSITKAKEKRPEAEKYMRNEYQLSEVRFHSSLPYTGALMPTNDAGKRMYWPEKKP